MKRPWLVGIIPACLILIFGLIAGLTKTTPASLVWLGFFAYFIIAETYFIVTKTPGGTLTAVVVKIFGVRETDKWSRVRTVCLWICLIWLFLHFVSGGVI